MSKSKGKRIIIIAIISALITALIQMTYEGLSPVGAGFWATPIFISALFITSTLSVSFSIVPVIVGFSILAAMLIALGIINEEIFRKIKTRTNKVIASVLFSIFVYVIVWFAVVPATDPVIQNLNGVVFFLTYVIWGLIIGFTSKLET
jgi:hypothetical protein